MGAHATPALDINPKLDILTNREIIALSQDLRGWPVVTPFLEKNALAELPVYMDQKTAISRAMNIKGLPTSILLDREGRELGRLAGHAEWDSREALALIDYFAKAPP